MKKFFSVFAAIFICMLCMPVFTACDNAVGTDLKGALFTKKVFEADVGEPFLLTYKTFPSTAENVNVKFEFDVQPTMYIMDSNNQFTIVDPSCKVINAKITYGAGENNFDTCQIVQKEYPTEIYFEKVQDGLNKNGSYNLRLMAKMKDDSIKPIDRSMYNIELRSSAPQVVSVSESSLVAVSTGLNGSATIEARIRKINGSYLGVTSINTEGLVASTTLTIIDSVDKAVVSLSGVSGLVNASNTREQAQQNPITTNQPTLKLNILLYSVADICLNDFININVISENPTISVSPITNGSDWLFQLDLTNFSGASYIQIISDAVDENGNPKCFIFYITKENSGS